MSESKDKKLVRGDVGTGSNGVVGGELVVDGKRIEDRGKGNVGVTRKWDDWWEGELNAWNGNVVSAKTTCLEMYNLPVVGLRQR